VVDVVGIAHLHSAVVTPASLTLVLSTYIGCRVRAPVAAFTATATTEPGRPLLTVDRPVSRRVSKQLLVVFVPISSVVNSLLLAMRTVIGSPVSEQLHAMLVLIGNVVTSSFLAVCGVIAGVISGYLLTASDSVGSLLLTICGIVGHAVRESLFAMLSTVGGSLSAMCGTVGGIISGFRCAAGDTAATVVGVQVSTRRPMRTKEIDSGDGTIRHAITVRSVVAMPPELRRSRGHSVP
jgi:uncharacterized membrane protein YeaQ/YmgE (transglycosylase-associated protein family)